VTSRPRGRRLVAAWLLLIVVAGVGIGAGACGRRESSDEGNRAARPNVLLITIDTFRADHLGASGYARPTTPALDALAAAGARFTHAISQAPETAPSHATILTGAVPPEHAVRSNGVYALPDAATTLAEVLRASGYKTAAFVGSFVLDKRFGFAQGFDVYDDRMDASAESGAGAGSGAGAAVPDSAVWYGNIVAGAFDRRADVVAGAALRWLESNHDSPFFAWIHFYDPHAPYEPPAAHDIFPKRDPASTHARWDEFERAHLSGAAAPNDSAPGGGLDPALTAELATLSEDLVALYDGEIRFCDAEVGAILARLDAWGVRENTLVVVTSDHGESLAENAYYFRHGWYLFDNVLRVPLIVSLPGRVAPGTVVDDQVELTDLFETILAAAPGVKRGAAGETGGGSGRDLLALAARHAGKSAGRDERARDFAYSETFLRKQLVGGKPQFGLRTSRWKYFGSLLETARARRHLFDLAGDGDALNVAADNSAIADSLEATLRAFLAACEERSLAAGDANRIEPDDATIERLRALGYVR